MHQQRPERTERLSEHEVAGTAGTSFCEVNPHWLQNIVRLSETFDVKASNDIVDDRGFTLWQRGMRVSSDLGEMLPGKRLRRPPEVSVGVDNALTTDDVVADCIALIEQHRPLQALAGQKGALDFLRGMRSIAFAEPLAVIATAARELRRQDYDTSLAAAIVSAGLADQAGFSEQDATSMILAALLSDIGETYVDPAYLDHSRELKPMEWEHIVRHPYIGESFLREFTQYPPTVSGGILQHHERFDGHGYPFGVTGERLRMPFMMLGTADTVAAIIMRGGASVAARISVALHILPGEFPPPAVSLVTKMLDGMEKTSADGPCARVAEGLPPVLEQLGAAKREAARLVHSEHGLAVVNAAELALSLLLRMDQSLGAAKVYELMQRNGKEDDPAIASLIRAVPDELAWRLRSLARNVYLEAAQSGNSQDLAALVDLVGLLDPGSSPENRETIRE